MNIFAHFSRCNLLKLTLLQGCLLFVVSAHCIAVGAATTPAKTEAVGSGWRLTATGSYQLIPDIELGKLVDEKPTFCVEPRPDGRPIAWTDPAGIKQQLSLSNERGVLRWWSAPTKQQLIWSSGSHVAAVSESQSEQLAVITQLTAPKRLTVVWPEPSWRRYSAADLTDPLKPKALWQWQPPILGTVQTPVSLLLKTSSGATSALLMVSGADAVQPALWVVDANSGQLIATQQYQRAIKTVELPFLLTDIVAAPAVLDRNADGYTDRIYLLDSQGRLVQIDISEQLQFQSRVVADLSDTAAQFNVQPVASRAVLPNPQLFTTSESAMPDMRAGDDRDDGANAAGIAGQEADILMFYSTKAEQSQIWVLMIPDSPAFTIQPHHLIQRDLQTDATAVVTTTSVTAGWYGILPAPPVTLPQLFAGVLYLPLAASANSCAGARQANQLFARHVFQGSAVYTKEQLAGVAAPFGIPTAVQRSSGEIALQDRQSGALLLPQIRGVRADCRFCTEPLLQSHYPKWQRMAIYQHEAEIYR